MKKYHLAQVNIARMKTHLEHPSMKNFVDQLDKINALAEESSGFVWRLKDETGHATEIQAFDDPKLIINMSVWEDVASLKEFTYKTAHAGVMRNRNQWFEHLDFYMVLWWIPIGHQPTLEEAKQKLELLKEQGATQAAFSFREIFSTPA